MWRLRWHRYNVWHASPGCGYVVPPPHSAVFLCALGVYVRWLVACGLWLVACGLWLVACGLWLVAGGLWLSFELVFHVRCRAGERGRGWWGSIVKPFATHPFRRAPPVFYPSLVCTSSGALPWACNSSHVRLDGLVAGAVADALAARVRPTAYVDRVRCEESDPSAAAVWVRFSSSAAALDGAP